MRVNSTPCFKLFEQQPSSFTTHNLTGFSHLTNSIRSKEDPCVSCRPEREGTPPLTRITGIIEDLNFRVVAIILQRGLCCVRLPLCDLSLL